MIMESWIIGLDRIEIGDYSMLHTEGRRKKIL